MRMIIMNKKNLSDIVNEEKPLLSLSRLAEKFNNQPYGLKAAEAIIGGGLSLATLTSCSGIVTPQPPGQLEQLYYNVPYVALPADSQLGGVASVIMVLNYYDEGLSMESFGPKITTDGRLDYKKLSDYLEDNNYSHDFFRIDAIDGINNIKGVLERGPVMIIKELNLNGSYSSNPYRVLIGWDNNKETFITHDPIKGKNFEINYGDFFDHSYKCMLVKCIDVCLFYEIRPKNRLKDDTKRYQEQAINIVDSQMDSILGKF